MPSKTADPGVCPVSSLNQRTRPLLCPVELVKKIKISSSMATLNERWQLWVVLKSGMSVATNIYPMVLPYNMIQCARDFCSEISKHFRRENKSYKIQNWPVLVLNYTKRAYFKSFKYLWEEALVNSRVQDKYPGLWPSAPSQIACSREILQYATMST